MSFRKLLTDHKKIPEINAIRGIAVLLVLLNHASEGIAGRPQWLVYGASGVNLFFILSGFVIYLTLDHTKYWKDFALKRFIRIYPTYWICVTFSAALMIVYSFYKSTFTFNTVLIYLGNMTMLEHYLRIPYIDQSYWTMIIELLFYVFMLIVFVTKRLHKIEPIGYGILIFELFDYLYLNENFHSLHEAIKEWIPLLMYFPLFFSGILFYKIKFDKPSVPRYLGVLACLLVQITMSYTQRHIPVPISFSENVWLLIGYHLFFLFVVHNRVNFIINKPLLFYAEISYALYLINLYLVKEFLTPIMTQKLGCNLWASMTVSVLITTALGAAITYWMEKPIMERLKERLL